MNVRIPALAAPTAAALALAVLAGSAHADGMRRGSVKDAPPPPPQERCKLSANIAVATEYVFRGISQTSEGAAVQGGFDATCGMFYAGVWASNLDWGANDGGSGRNIANIEMDWYGGLKFNTGRIAWDVGVIYYSYPNGADIGTSAAGVFPVSAEFNYVELKVGASAELWKDGTLGVTGFFSPDYQYETGNVWTVEGAFTQNLPKFMLLGREWSPSVSALLGYQAATGSDADRARYVNNVTGDADHYLYWNAGLTLGFMDKWSIDVRYWDTNIDRADNCKGPLFACDERVVGTLKFTF
ncbi:MAG TPA: TorF family putative porin [Hyphomicrobiaceae bacterium]|nr:TorF family putative porin [Hyphomicrobiaceae bacterium]